MNKNFGDYLYALRTEKGWTQQHLADLLGVTNKTVSKWERNEGYPSIDTLLSLSKLFNVSVDELLKGGNNSSQEDSMEILLQGWNSKKINMFSNFILVIGLLFFFGIYFVTSSAVLSFFMFLIIASISLFLLVYKQEKNAYLTQKERTLKDYGIWALCFCGCLSMMLPCLLARMIAMIVLGKSKLSYVSYDVYLSFKDYLITWLPVGLGLSILFLIAVKIIRDGSYNQLKIKMRKAFIGFIVSLFVFLGILGSAYSIKFRSNFEYESFKMNYKNAVRAFGGEMYNVTLMNNHFAEKKRYEQYMNLVACIDGVNALVYRPNAKDITDRIKINNWLFLVLSVGSGYYLFYKKEKKNGENEDV